MSDAEMITILILFHSNTFRNFKHFYLFYVCRELKEEFPNLLSYTRFVGRMPRVAIPLLLFLKLALMGECTGITFIDSTRIPVCETSVSILTSPTLLIGARERAIFLSSSSAWALSDRSSSSLLHWPLAIAL